MHSFVCMWCYREARSCCWEVNNFFILFMYIYIHVCVHIHVCVFAHVHAHIPVETRGSLRCPQDPLK